MGAKIDIKLLDYFNDTSYVKVYKQKTRNLDVITICGYSAETKSDFILSFDKPTAIKLSKLIRTEINKL